MSVQKVSNQDFSISAEVSYRPQDSRYETGEFLFAYRIRITNKGSASAQLMSRHWIITDGLGHVEEVRGAGVVGLQPHIQPGQTFEYESGCPLTTSSGSMRGSYQMISSEGEQFEIEIPEFYLVAPSALH
jgi:ApaG protein